MLISVFFSLMKILKYQSFLKVESLAAILFLATIIFVIAFQCLQRELIVTAQSSDWKSSVVDDRSVGGNSFIENLSDESRFKFAFETQDTEKDAYALFLLMPENGESTTDLSWFQNVTFKAHVDGGEPQLFLFILRDQVDHLYSKDDSTSLKYNESFIELTNTSRTITLPKGGFQVARWWVVDKEAELEDTAPSFDNFAWIEFAICNPNEANSGTVVIDSIAFTGPIIPPVDFYRGLFFIWFLLALPLCVRFYQNAKKTRSIRKSRRNQEAEIEEKLGNSGSKNRTAVSDTDEIVIRDLLTGLPNRFGIRDEIDQAIQAVRRGEERANIILFDVDDIKLFNESQGEAEGDKLLQKIATIAKAALPTQHSVARWNDDKFLILCHGQSREASKDLACEIRKRIENETSATCSFGVHQINPINHFEEVFERVSKCVDEAKFNGKNKVVLFNLRESKIAIESNPLIINQDTPVNETLV